jgi:hypothetical protein
MHRKQRRQCAWQVGRPPLDHACMHSRQQRQWYSGVSFERVMSGVRPAAHNCKSDEQTAGAADGHWNRALKGPNLFKVSPDKNRSAGKTANASNLASCRSQHCKFARYFGGERERENVCVRCWCDFSVRRGHSAKADADVLNIYLVPFQSAEIIFMLYGRFWVFI